MIEKITDHSLERYDSRLKEWCDRKFFEKGNYGKYETTEEAGAVAFYSAPDTPLEGKVKFSFKETPPASGDKSPSNPSTISGVSSVKVTRCGKNLLGYNYNSKTVQPGSSVTISGVTVSNDHGVYSISGSNTSGGTVGFDIVTQGSQELVLPSGYYVFSANFPSGFLADARIQIVGYQNEDIVVNTYSKDTSRTFTVPNGDPVVFRLYIRIGTGVVIPSGCVASPQIELNSTATSFEPYDGTDYTIPLGSTYYGGEIDLASGVMTVTHVCAEFDGTELWEDITNYNSTTGIGYARCYPNIIANKRPSYEFPTFSDPSTTYKFYSCTHFPVLRVFGTTPIENGEITSPCMWYTGGSDEATGQARFAVPFSTKEALKSWLADQKLAGTPMQIAFKIHEPFTVQLTPQQILSIPQLDKYTPRLNTVYTDADSIQISYLKSPIRDEYEKTQAILSLGGNS